MVWQEIGIVTSAQIKRNYLQRILTEIQEMIKDQCRGECWEERQAKEDCWGDCWEQCHHYPTSNPLFPSALPALLGNRDVVRPVASCLDSK